MYNCYYYFLCRMSQLFVAATDMLFYETCVSSAWSAVCWKSLCWSCLWEHWEDISVFYLYYSALLAATHSVPLPTVVRTFTASEIFFSVEGFMLTVWNKVSTEILKTRCPSEVAGVVGFVEVGVKLISSFHQNGKSTGIWNIIFYSSSWGPPPSLSLACPQKLLFACWNKCCVSF